jgi:hypothetical protein
MWGMGLWEEPGECMSAVYPWGGWGGGGHGKSQGTPSDQGMSKIDLSGKS